MKTKIFFIVICNLLICPEYSGLIAQNITNTLGSSGAFNLKDNSTTFLTLTQTNGDLSLNRSLRLPHTISSIAVIVLKGADNERIIII